MVELTLLKSLFLMIKSSALSMMRDNLY